MTTAAERRKDVLRLAAQRAAEMPRCEVCGLWTHGDVRDNAYFAMHGIALALEAGAEGGRSAAAGEGTGGNEATRMEADAGSSAHTGQAASSTGTGLDAGPTRMKLDVGSAGAERMDSSLYATCVDVLGRVLALQQTDPQRELYGHFPLTMPADHEKVRPHELPVELLGCLLIVFARRYGRRLPAGLQAALETAIRHVYESRFYDHEVKAHNHHEAKWTAHKLLHGAWFGDEALLARGYASLRAQLARLRERGMREYGALPWFWHWVQAMACAWEVVPAGEVRDKLEAMLRLLWEERSRWYLRGAWAGPHSRGLPHDVPADRYVLHDYVQFGDFSLEALQGDVPRLEGAGFLAYDVPDDVRESAVKLAAVSELRQKIVLEAPTAEGNGAEAEGAAEAHMYLYRTPLYAVGGMWERTHEYANEQLRWDVTLPFRDGGNQLYVFPPGAGYAAGDPRHACDGAHVVFARHAVLAVHALAAEAPGAASLDGRLPAGAWRFAEDGCACFGEADGVYLAVRSLRPLQATPLPGGGYALAAEGLFHAVAVEAWSAQEAAAHGLAGLGAFAAAVRALPLQTEHGPDGRPVRAFSGTLDGAALALAAPAATAAPAASWQPFIDGEPVDFSLYRVMTAAARQ
jgi:hypothetical protein